MSVVCLCSKIVRELADPAAAASQSSFVVLLQKQSVIYLLGKFGMQHINLRFTLCYFNTFLYYNTVAVLTAFIALHTYNTILFSMFIKMHIKSL